MFLLPIGREASAKSQANGLSITVVLYGHGFYFSNIFCAGPDK